MHTHTHTCTHAHTHTQLARTHTYRGKQSFDQAGVGVEQPAEVVKEDDMFEVYRKRMMLAYRFRPNPLVRFWLLNSVVRFNCLSQLSKTTHQL